MTSKSVMVGLSGFNPRSREGSDTDANEQAIDRKVSIHAPVKEATAVVLSDSR